MKKILPFLFIFFAVISCENEDDNQNHCINGIMDANETGVDCGGDCDPCIVLPTCNDGIQNGDETGVDCGGSCDPCGTISTCNDGIQNGDETGVDCGGSCDPCGTISTCNDGVQNGDETGVDCGGSCPPCPVQNNYFMRCKLDGLSWNAIMSGFLRANVDINGFVNGYRNFSSEGQIRIGNIDKFLTTGSYTYTNGSFVSGSANFFYSPSSPSTPMPYRYYRAIDGEGSLEVTEVNLVDSTVRGTFSLRVHDYNITPFDTIQITEGEFFLPFDN